MPLGLGDISLCKYPSNGKYIDYGHYNKTGEKVYLYNDHTNNYYYKFIWTKFKSKLAQSLNGYLSYL